MAKITELPAATTPLSASDIIPVVQGGVTKQSPISGLPLSGGLTNLTEAKNTAAPNATIPAVSLSVTITETNGDIVIAPKGTGAVLAAVPNNLASGGNKRGAYAVDLQRDRANPDQVASGDRSVVVGGSGNKATDNYSYCGGGNTNTSSANGTVVSGGVTNSATAAQATVCGGNANTASGQRAAVLGGSSNTANTAAAAICGGQSNVASGGSSFVGGGQNNTASGANSAILGGFYGTTRGVEAAQAHSAGPFSVQGDAQREVFVLRQSTANATPARLTADTGGGATNNQVVLPNSSAYGFTGRVVARNNANGDCSSWEFKGTIRRGANAAATALVAAVTPTVVSQDAGASTWAVSVTADTTNGALAITVTGVAATNIKWVADIETVEVVG